MERCSPFVSMALWGEQTATCFTCFARVRCNQHKIQTRCPKNGGTGYETFPRPSILTALTRPAIPSSPLSFPRFAATPSPSRNARQVCCRVWNHSPDVCSRCCWVNVEGWELSGYQDDGVKGGREREGGRRRRYSGW